MTARGIIKLVVPPCRTVDEGSRIQPDSSNVRQGKSTLKLQALLFGFSALAIALIARASADCDGLDGPVVSVAQKALETGEVNLVLIWVQKPDEAEIKRAFEQTLVVRSLSTSARELADQYFFETLVRIHRAGEDAPFPGLKPTGCDLGSAIPAADNALGDGDAGGVQKLLIDSLDRGVQEHFARARVTKDFDTNDALEGRKFVKSYVEYIHCVEALYQQATTAVHGHYHEEEQAAREHEH
jgi:Family of unknown function (DUF6448)